MYPNRENVEKLNNIFSSNEDLEIKLLKSVEILRSLLESSDDRELDVSVASGGGLKATIKDDGLKVFVFKVSKGEEYESEDDATRENVNRVGMDHALNKLLEKIGDPVDFELPDCLRESKFTPYTFIKRSILATNEGISTFLRYSADYLEDKLIGEGAFGRAFRCTHKLDRGEYVIKKVPFNEHDREKKLKEVISLKMAQHKNVVRYYQCWTEERTLFIVMDYYPMTLKDKLVKKLEETEILHFFKQLMKGLKHIHEAGVIHFDIKPDNLFIDEFNNLKIGDFGLAASTGESYGENFAGFVCFDTYFRAPEMQYLSRNLTNKVDIFSAGAVLLEMVISPAMNSFDKMSAFEDAAMGLFPEVVDVNITRLLKWCLTRDSIKRPSANEILNELLSMKF